MPEKILTINDLSSPEVISAVRDQIISALVAGSNVTLTPLGSGESQILTISSSGGGGQVFVDGQLAVGTVAGYIKAASEPTDSVPGNNRGSGAVDFQQKRDDASKVASGAFSFIGGGRNNRNEGELGFVGGGFNNSNSGFKSSIPCGDTNSVFSAAESSCILGGASHQLYAGYSSILGGLMSRSESELSTVIGGLRGYCRRTGEVVHALATSLGAAQHVDLILIATTTDASPVFAGIAGSQPVQIFSGQTFSFVAYVNGVKSDGTKVASFIRRGVIKNFSGTTSLGGAVQTIGTDIETDSATDVSVTANDSNDSLEISVTGITGETWSWVVSLEAVEIIP